VAAAFFWRHRRGALGGATRTKWRGATDQVARRSWPQDAAAVESFFVAISAIVRRYLEDRFDLRAPELTTEEFSRWPDPPAVCRATPAAVARLPAPGRSREIRRRACLGR